MKILFSIIFIMLLSCPTPFDQIPPVLGIPNHMPNHANQIFLSSCIQIINTFLSNTHNTLQKVQILRAASPSKLENTVNNNSIFNTKCAEFSTKWKVLIHFHYLTYVYNHSYKLHHKSVPLLQLLFTCLFSPYFFITSVLKSKSLTLSSSVPQQFFIFLFLCTGIRTICKKVFSLPQSFSQFRLRQEPTSKAVLLRLTLFYFISSS